MNTQIFVTHRPLDGARILLCGDCARGMPADHVREVDHREGGLMVIGGLSETDPAVCETCSSAMIAHDTPRQIVMHVTPMLLRERGLWDRACDVLGINPWAMNEGLMSDTDNLPLNREQADALFGRP